MNAPGRQLSAAQVDELQMCTDRLARLSSATGWPHLAVLAKQLAQLSADAVGKRAAVQLRGEQAVGEEMGGMPSETILRALSFCGAKDLMLVRRASRGLGRLARAELAGTARLGRFERAFPRELRPRARWQECTSPVGAQPEIWVTCDSARLVPRYEHEQLARAQARAVGDLVLSGHSGQMPDSLLPIGVYELQAGLKCGFPWFFNKVFRIWLRHIGAVWVLSDEPDGGLGLVLSVHSMALTPDVIGRGITDQMEQERQYDKETRQQLFEHGYP
eukprot:g2924.t1